MQLIDLIGNKFDRLTVIRRVENLKSKSTLWLCKCDCGNETVVDGGNLRKGHTTSCGCFHKERSKQFNTIHGQKNSPTYKSWCRMIQRCSNTRNNRYVIYGGRGIKVCKEWECFEKFYKDMGDRPTNTSIDRLDVNGDYYKENCRWATKVQQANNTTRNRNVTYNGKTQTLAQWSKETGILSDTIRYRLNNGWTAEKIFNLQN